MGQHRSFSLSIDIDAPPDRVAAVMIDIERWHEWTASITKIERLDDGPLRAGSRARVWQPKFPPALWTVTSVDRDGFTWVSTGPALRVTGRHRVEPRGPASRATLSLTYEGVLGRLIGRLTAGITRRYVTLEANGLKARSEGR